MSRPSARRGQLKVGLVGVGPRGLSVLERICANERKSGSHREVSVHVVDPFPAGAGRVWRTSQSDQLLMNTVASQITLFTDDSVEMDGPVEPGPSLYEWARELGRNADGAGADERTLAEARRLGPDAYPTRAFYGVYLRSVFRRVVADAPRHVTVTVHQAQAIGLDNSGPLADGPQTLTLDNGVRLTDLDTVVLAQGHVPALPAPHEEELARAAAEHGLLYIPPANPADVDLGGIEPGQTVLLRGLGLNFFDHMALLTSGRGGTFRTEDGRLVYEPSGREPKIYAGSRRGIPYHARGENEKGAHGRYVPRLLTPATIAGLRRRAVDGERVHFGTDLWPLIAKEVESVYYGTLLEVRGRAADREAFTERYLAAPAGEAERRLLDAFGFAPDDRWSWDALARPQGNRTYPSPAAFRQWLLDYLGEDVRAARAGNVSGPLKAALDVLRDLRNEIRLTVDHGGLEGNSYRDELTAWYTPLNAFLSIGPPASRIEELVALIEAGVVRIIGPGLHLTVDETLPSFVAGSDTVRGGRIRASVLIEARLPEPDLRRTADPLLRHLLTTGQCRPYDIPGTCGTSYRTGGLAVTERPYRTVDVHGSPHPRRFAYGVPTEAVHWVTAAGIRPGVNSVTLGDSDAIARALLNIRAADSPLQSVRGGEPQEGHDGLHGGQREAIA
ncbi:FAD/NAD(P)-binding domain-containing protein [Streptomyces sp. Rer75]|uniref:FAD/NAD(P)-binding protein n=1 Tax=Streptomyces sp. Rer75 TaxID=2750011 RepID=UPI0015D06331|nr:FAD/NAD(P)-binding protein [Streptomyces sp. Rer75]QLH25567.1 FAD/NAD(P)-binding protein [Streptomyces sp. Rer75]